MQSINKNSSASKLCAVYGSNRRRAGNRDCYRHKKGTEQRGIMFSAFRTTNISRSTATTATNTQTKMGNADDRRKYQHLTVLNFKQFMKNTANPQDIRINNAQTQNGHNITQFTYPYQLSAPAHHHNLGTVLNATPVEYDTAPT